MNSIQKTIGMLVGLSSFKKVLLILFIHAIASVSSQAQQNIMVTGNVADVQGISIPGVTIYVKNSTGGTITDLKGNYQITVQNETDVLVFSFIGFENQEIVISKQRVLNVILKENIKLIDEVVVTGYSVQKKASVTGAIEQIGGEILARSPSINVSNGLVGKVAGIASVQKTGEPGFEESTIRIRGVGTYSGDQNPLIVIDGIIRDMTSFNLLDAEDIENVSVLKDASATAVYGVRGANGVIIVTTKRGKTGKMKFDMKASYGLTRATEVPQLVNSYDYAVLKNEGFVNDGKPNDKRIFTEDELWKFENNRDYTPDEVAVMTNLTQEQRIALLNSPAAYYTSTNYMDEIFGSATAPQQKYSLNISGGTKDVDYFTSIGYANQKSLINTFDLPNVPSNTGSNRTNFRSNYDFKMIKNTEINVSLSGQFRETSIITDRNGSSSIGGRYRDLLLNAYEAPPYSGVGIYGDKIINGYAGGTIMHANKKAWGQTPIAYMMGKEQANIYQTNLNSSIRIKHKMDYMLEGLSARGAISYDHYFTKTLTVDNNVPMYTFTRNPNDPAELQFYGGQQYPVGLSEGSWGKNRKIYLEGGIDFYKEIGVHTFTVMALITGEKRTSPGLRYNVPQGFYGTVGRVTYDYNQRYLAEFNMGYNGSENFAPGKQFGFFPAVSAGWVISNEPFFPKNRIVNWVKLRGSFGQTGNSSIGGNRFLYLPGTWASHSFETPYQGYYFGSSDGTTFNPAYAGMYEQTVGNPDVTWEKKDSYNLALELRFLKQRLSTTVDLFREKRNNILTTLETTSGTIGLAGDALPPVNVGEMTNQGFEVQTTWRDKIGDFNYGINAQLSYAVNKIDYKAEPPYQYDWMNTTGFSYGQYKAYYNEGFYNNAEEVANHPYNDVDGNKVQGGDLRIVDVNGDGKVDNKDITPTGYSNIPRYTFGGTINLGYKGFSIIATLSGTSQGSFSMNGYLNVPFSQGQSTPLSYMKDRWTVENYESGKEIQFPRMSTNLSNTQNYYQNAFWYRATDHIKLKNIEVSYSFDKHEFIRKSKITSLRVFINANNIYTWGGKDLIAGIDPELVQDSNTSEGIIYPLTRIINTGVNIQF